MTRIKFCGFTRTEDVSEAVALGVDAIGFVRAAESPRCVTLESAALMGWTAGPYVAKFLVYRHCDEEPLSGFGIQAATFSSSAGLHECVYVPVIPVGSQTEVDRHLAASEGSWPPIAAFLLDSVKDRRIGGSGTTCDWEVAGDLVRQTSVPVILAGGLTPDNVGEAIRRVRPYAVDVSSGIESSPGVKDHGKMKAFVEAVRAADREL